MSLYVNGTAVSGGSGGAALSDATPEPTGTAVTAGPGVATSAARADHVHATAAPSVPAEIVNGGGTAGSLTTTLGSGGYQAIRVSGVVRDASGNGLQARGTLRFYATGSGGEFYSILDYAGTRGNTTLGAAGGVSGVMAGEFDFETDASGGFDFKINFTGGGPAVRVFVQSGAGVASTSGTLL